MQDSDQPNDKDAIFRDVERILLEISADWSTGPINKETLLGSVLLESISAVYFIGDLQQRYGLQDALFQKLRALEVKMTNLRVTDVVDMISNTLAEQASHRS